MANRIALFLRYLLILRQKYIKEKSFITLLSIFIGITSGLGAVVIKNSVHFIQHFIVTIFPKDIYSYYYFIFPGIGILLAVLFARFIVKQRIGHGIPSTLYAISKQNSIMKKHNMYSSVVTSALTVGFGGSVGLEGPTVATGASIGSNIAQLFRLNYKYRTLLIGCAAAGAMSAIFKSPIAAIVFAIEVIMLDLTFASLIPLLLASSSAALTSYFFLGTDVLLHLEIKQGYLLKNIPYYIILGLISGLFSVYFTRVYVRINDFFEKLTKPATRLLMGGIFLGLIVILFPPLYGEGYSTINNLLAGNHTEAFNHGIISFNHDNLVWLIVFFTLLALFKVVATSVTFGAGGVGGIFAPTLFMGANAGFAFSILLEILGFENINNTNITLVGMAGAIAGVLHAPLTAIFLIAEITEGYHLFFPLMITAAISFITTVSFEPHSVYTIQLAKRGELLTHHKDKTVLAMLKVKGLVETNFIVMHPDQTLGELVEAVKKSVRNIFPVVDEENNFLGLIPLDNIRHIMFDREQYQKVKVEDLLIHPPEIVTTENTMEEVMEKFRKSGNWNLPVVENGKYLGFVSRANIFNAYRQKLLEFSED